MLVWTAVARGAVHGWPLAVALLLTLLAALAWLLAMLRQGVLEWRRTAIDVPLALMFLLVLVQVALGNGGLREWALAPPAAPPEFTAALPARFWLLGTVAPIHTLQALAVFAMYGAVYMLVVNVIRERRQLQSLIRALLVVGSLLAFAGLLDYVVGESWVLRWKEPHGEARLRATFNNPDHFAAWLTMLVCLGVGALAGSGSRGRHESGVPLATRLSSRALREDLMRRYLPFVGTVIAALGIVFTLSRGAIMGLLVGLGVMLVLFGRLGWMRWGVSILGAFGAITLVLASWIGLAPILARLQLDPSRLEMWWGTLPMVGTFPVFGVGLGTYGDIFFRYQRAALRPGVTYVSDAHNEFLQLVVETGLLGAAIAGWIGWRLVRDLVLTHLFGRGRCPVGGGEGPPAQRHDPFSVGTTIGALGAALALCVHSLVDFPARIPANGVLAATCLGIATVALHTRFDRPSMVLVEQWSWSWGRRRFVPAVLGLAAVTVAVTLVPWIVRPARIGQALTPGGGTPALARIEAALAIDPGDPGALALRGQERARVARDAPQFTLVQGAIGDLRAAAAAVPSDPLVHERLAWAYEMLTRLEPERASEHEALAVSHLARAIALAPENPFLRRSMAVLTITRPPLVAMALDAARATVARDPATLLELVETFDRAALTESQWVSMVPATWEDRLDLGRFLEGRGRSQAAEAAYRAAIEVAPVDERAVGVWMLAALLIRNGQAPSGAKEINQVLANDPRNPELLLVFGAALEAQGDPAALDAYRAAVWQTTTTASDGRLPALRSRSPRVQALIAERTGDPETASLRCRHALARYLMAHRMWDQAGDEWDAILAMTPRDAEAHFSRGMVWESVGMQDRALARYREAVGLEALPQFRLRLARLLWDVEQFVPAMNEWRSVLETEPNNVEARLGLARARLKEGDRLAAYHEFKRVLAVEPDNQAARREVDRLTGAAR